MLDINKVRELKHIVQMQTGYCDLLRNMQELKLHNYEVESAIKAAIETSADTVNEQVWDLFTDYYGITAAQHNDYETFDEVYERLVEKSGSIKYLLADEYGNCVKFINPIPVEFLEILEKEANFYIEIDTEDEKIAIY